MSVNALTENYVYNPYQTSNGYEIKTYDPSIWQNQNPTTVTYNPTCEDGSDDGKISFGSKVKNFFKGIGNTIKGAVKSLATPKGFLKAAACVALCAIPGVGPIAAVALGAVGVAKGAKTVIQGAKAAHNATTDAEAEEAWQNIGSGSFQVAASAVATKAGIKGIKAQGGLKVTAETAKSSIKNIGTKAKDLGSYAKQSYQLNRTFENGVIKSASAAAKDTLTEAGVNTAQISSKLSSLKSTAKNTYELNRTFENGVIKSASAAAKDVVSDITKNMKNASVIKDTKAAASMAKEAIKGGAKVTDVIKDTYGATVGSSATMANLQTAASMVKEAVKSGTKLSTAVTDTASALGITAQDVMTATTLFGVEAGNEIENNSQTTGQETIPVTTIKYDPNSYMTGL